MEKLLLPLGKGFAVIFIGIKGVHAFEWLRPGEVALVDPDRTKDAGCLGVHFLFLRVVLNIIKIVFNVFRHVLRVGVEDTTFRPVPFVYSIILPSHCETSQNSA